MIDCSLKKNWNKQKCKKSIGEAHFAMILPKADNSGSKIKPEVFSKYIKRINDHFGGSTTFPKTLGCWFDDERGKLQCEQGMSVESFRDFDVDPSMQKLNAHERKKVLEKDYKFMQKIAKESAEEFGQDSVPVIFDNISDVSLNKGVWKKKIEKNKLTGKKYGSNLWEQEI